MLIHALTILYLLIWANLAATEGDETIPRHRQKRFLGCFNVIECLGDVITIFPLRYNIDLFKIYYRLKGNDGTNRSKKVFNNIL